MELPTTPPVATSPSPPPVQIASLPWRKLQRAPLLGAHARLHLQRGPPLPEQSVTVLHLWREALVLEVARGETAQACGKLPAPPQVVARLSRSQLKVMAPGYVD